MASTLGRVCILVAITCMGCERPPLAWSDPVEVSVAGDSLRLVIDRAGRARFVVPHVAMRARPMEPGMCAASFRAVNGAHDLYGVWWSVRADSSAVLYAAVSDDSGSTWRAPTRVDTADASSRGCERPPPSVATVGDDLHVAYSMAATEGTGVFFAHSMDRGRMFHSPVAIEYGDRLVNTSVAGDGNDVVVAYEEPNGTRAAVDVALSRTLGHIFEARTAASRSTDAAVSPLVAIAGRRVAVSWIERRESGADTSRAARLIRAGTLP